MFKDIKQCEKYCELKSTSCCLYNRFRAALPVLEVEYQFWMENRSVDLELNGKQHVLNRYYVEAGLPRYV